MAQPKNKIGPKPFSYFLDISNKAMANRIRKGLIYEKFTARIMRIE
uniref:Uncharacterized protein n=1 Tax=Rhizophora mucronata TaxID=61149 RepID=A0A2P2Q0G8_RHIMU